MLFIKVSIYSEFVTNLNKLHNEEYVLRYTVPRWWGTNVVKLRK